MPQLIEHIDAIARQKQRDVLFLKFQPLVVNSVVDSDEEDVLSDFDDPWEELPIRRHIIEWLDAQGIGWQCCGDLANPNSMMSYQGQIYINVPYEKSLAAYQALEVFLENPDGSMRFPEVRFFCCSLKLAMENAAHDNPEFWKRWAEDF